MLKRQLALVSVSIYCAKQITFFIPTAHTSDRPVLRAWPTPGTVRSEVFRAKILQPNAIAAGACGLETFCLSHRLLFLGVGAMSSASSSLEFDGLAAKEKANFNKAIDAYARDGSLPHNCVYTELTRRMTIIRNVSQCPHVYNGWKNLSWLMDTWMDRDLWEASARREMKDKESSSPTTSGWMSNA